MFDAVLLVVGLGWLYLWLKGNWFAAIVGMPISAYIFLTVRTWSHPGPLTEWQWVGLFCSTFAAAVPLTIRQGLAEDRARRNIRGITLNKQVDARFKG